VSVPGTALADHATSAAVAVDVAVFTVRAGQLQVLLVQARGGPFAGAWALPGGRVHEDESLDDAAGRELLAQTAVHDVYLEQLYTFGHPRRDPHDRVVSVAYVGLVADPDRVTGPAAAGKYDAVCWRAAARLPALAYDHGAVVRLAVARLRAKLQYTNLAYTLLPAAFTLGELQSLYESILGRRLDRRNFRRKVLSLGLLRSLGRLRRGPHRPAALYAFRSRRPMTVSVL
jgi:8-oxo-dGTP diphosphatase